MIQLAMRLGSVLVLEIAFSDMTPLYEVPGTRSDDTRISNEYGSDGGPTPSGQEIVAGTTEVRFAKRVSEEAGKGHRVELLLKTKVVLEREVGS